MVFPGPNKKYYYSDWKNLHKIHLCTNAGVMVYIGYIGYAYRVTNGMW